LSQTPPWLNPVTFSPPSLTWRSRNNIDRYF
jgi:hypothetical protein